MADTDPAGRDLYWFTVVPLDRPPEGSDLRAVAHDQVSLTPLRPDLTGPTALRARRL